MLSAEAIKSLVKDVFEPLNRHFNDLYSDASFQKIFGVYKIAVLPLMDDEKFYSEFEKISKIYTNPHLILDEHTKSFFEMFLLLYLKWLKKTGYDKKKLEKIKSVLQLDKLSEVTEMTEFLERIDNFCEISTSDMLQREGVDKDRVLDLVDMIHNERMLNGGDYHLSEMYLENVIEVLEELNDFLDVYEELHYLSMVLNRLVKSIKSIDISKLSDKENAEVKAVLDELLNEIEVWLKEVFINHNEGEVTFIESYILSVLAKLELINKGKN
ncbi:MAG: hypothetical protein GXO62_00760 [Epsilonproteobacteria bacterium]|nr:hypothetical protein [Campylobacterota bacterium]